MVKCGLKDFMEMFLHYPLRTKQQFFLMIKNEIFKIKY